MYNCHPQQISPYIDDVNYLIFYLFIQDRCRKSDTEIIIDMLKELKRPWNDICTKSVDR